MVGYDVDEICCARTTYRPLELLSCQRAHDGMKCYGDRLLNLMRKINTDISSLLHAVTS